MLLSLRCFVSDLQALPSPAQGSVCAALLLCAEDKAAADACAALGPPQVLSLPLVEPVCTLGLVLVPDATPCRRKTS